MKERVKHFCIKNRRFINTTSIIALVLIIFSLIFSSCSSMTAGVIYALPVEKPDNFEEIPYGGFGFSASLDTKYTEFTIDLYPWAPEVSAISSPKIFSSGFFLKYPFYFDSITLFPLLGIDAYIGGISFGGGINYSFSERWFLRGEALYGLGMPGGLFGTPFGDIGTLFAKASLGFRFKTDTSVKPKKLSKPSTSPAVIASVWEGDFSYRFEGKVNERTISITGYRGSNKEVVIPDNINNIRVTSIGRMAFQNKQLTSVTIPQGVTSIGSTAFAYNQLTSIIIPESVTTIGYGAFAHNQITSMTIPEGVITIGYTAFAYNQLIDVTIPTSVKSIGVLAFLDCTRLTDVNIKGTFTSVGTGAFIGCSRLRYVMISKRADIGKDAFPSTVEIRYRD